MSSPLRVLVVDDSAVVRQTLSQVLESDPAIRVMATAADPYAAARHIAEEVPDVITLDVEMPHMDGLTFLQKLMHQHPVPVLICSSLTEGNSATAVKAMECGAVDVIFKPRVGSREYMEESRTLLCDAVKAAASARMGAMTPPQLSVEPKQGADAVLARPNSQAMVETTDKVVLIGASTGGTEALRTVLEGLPADAPGTVVVQHMPENFTAAFATRLNGLCDVSVKEAESGDAVLQGRVLIAPGNRHLLLKRSGARYLVEVRDGPLVSRHRPSVDVLFRSGARYAGANAVGVLMTGMGDDGAQGLLELKNAGASTIAQDEATCVVFGMPAEAIRLGAADRVVPLQRLATEVLRFSRA